MIEGGEIWRSSFRVISHPRTSDSQPRQPMGASRGMGSEVPVLQGTGSDSQPQKAPDRADNMVYL